MNRDKLLTKLAMELDEWPLNTEDELPSGWVFRGPYVGVWGESSADSLFTERQWLQRRAELINKPSWDDAPEWAEWLAQDAPGFWYWYEFKPLSDCIRWDDFDGKYAFASHGTGPNGHDWRETLERRPMLQAFRTESRMDITTSLGATEFDEVRSDILGQNGNDGLHYMTEGEQELPAEERHDCDRCGGAWWSPMNNHCPCLDQFEEDDHEALTFRPIPERGRAGGLKFDADKPRMELLIQGMPRALEAVGQVLTFGAQKYSRTEMPYGQITAKRVFDICHADSVEKITTFTLSRGKNASPATTGGGTERWEDQCAVTVTQGAQSEFRRQANVAVVMKSDLKEKTQITLQGSGERAKSGFATIQIRWPKTSDGDTPALSGASTINLISVESAWRDLGSTKKVMLVSLNRAARCAGAQTAHLTSTTATIPGHSEDCFAVAATTDSECWEIAYKVLSELSLISAPLQEIKIDAAHSWQHVEDNHNRYWAAKSRHELARGKGETHDPETGMLHLAHEATNALFLLELALMDQDSEN